METVMVKERLESEDIARDTLKKMIKEFHRVMSKNEMVQKVEWFDFAGAIHNKKLTEKILKEELGQ